MSRPTSPPTMLATDADAIDAAVLALDAGGIVGLPTETVYGLGVVPSSAALEALIAAKQRPQDKGIALLIDDIDQIAGLVVVPATAHALAASFWPGPLTLVLPRLAGASLPELLTGGRDTLGIRLPDHTIPRALARRLGPLAVTSANRSGHPPAATADELIATVGGSLALVLDDGPVRGGVASTVIAVDGAGAIAILRAGTLSQAAIERAVAEVEG